MKTKIITFAAALLISASGFAKDIKVAVFTPTPEMHCASCETRIKDNIRFERGIKKIDTDLKTQTVTIKYDADAITAEAIQQAFEKIGFDVELVSDTPEKDKKKKN